MHKLNVFFFAMLLILLAGCSGAMSANKGVASTSTVPLAKTLEVAPTLTSVYVSESVNFVPIGGATPYSFTVNSACLGSITSAGVFTGTAVGTCTVTLTDGNGNVTTASVSVIKPAPTVTYSWVAGAWGGCSASCGSGIQSRSIACTGSDGSTGTSGQCSGAEPVTMQACNASVCGGTLNAISGPLFTPPQWGSPTGSATIGVYNVCNTSCTWPTCTSAQGATCSTLGSICAQAAAPILDDETEYYLYECVQ